MIVLPGLSEPLRAAGVCITSWREDDGCLRVQAQTATRRAACPRCAALSSRVHGHYQRRLHDLPSFGQPVTIVVEMLRFKCINDACALRSFSGTLGALAAPVRRRTERLDEALRRCGYALGGAAAARLAAHLGVHVSDDTVLREVRRAGVMQPASPPRVVGVDDWAITRGHRYGTIIVDLQKRCPIAVLGGREATVVADWLREHPSIKIVSRDRAGAYSEAVETAGPGIKQVADRWHLLANLRETVERMLMRRSASMREAARLATEEARASADPVGATVRAAVRSLTAWQRLSIERRAARKAQYDEIVHRRRLGDSFKAIGRAMELDQRTVSKFAQAPSFPERAQRPSGPMLLDRYRQHLVARVGQACPDAVQVWRELQAKGFTGSRATVRDAMVRARRSASKETRQSTAQRGMGCPSSRRAYAWLVGWPSVESPEIKREHRSFIETLCRIDPSISIAGSLARHFMGLIRRRDRAGFKTWMERTRACAVPELKRFAASLHADLSAVREAFSSPWSSGQVEGQINRLKFLKRQMFGRASLDLLRLRVLHPN